MLKIKNSHIASYQNFIYQSPMIISEVLSISLDQQIVYQNDITKINPWGGGGGGLGPDYCILEKVE